VFTCSDNLIEKYLKFNKGGEAPLLYHRWSMLAAISSVLKRGSWMRHGHNKIYPNQYIMLIGESGARKSTAIKLVKRILLKGDYNLIAGSKTSKEKFLLDLASGMENQNEDDPLDVTAQIRSRGVGRPTKQDTGSGLTATGFMAEMFGKKLANIPSCCLIAPDEFNTFLGHGNIEFIDLLTDLWDYEGEYSNRTKTSKSFSFWDPTITILGGNNYYGMTMAFPTEVVGQGFFSRLLLVFAEPTKRKVTWPRETPDEELEFFSSELREIGMRCTGEFKFSNEAKKMCDEIYHSWKELEDVRFRSYSSRRLVHLFKLCIVCAASAKSMDVNAEVVLYANTILAYTEFYMPDALGEFGKAKNSDVSAKILSIVENSDGPVSYAQLMKLLSRDVENKRQMGDILQKLAEAGKIQVGQAGILPMKRILHSTGKYVNFGLLQEYSDLQTELRMSL
jgi:hypothetical protein